MKSGRRELSCCFMRIRAGMLSALAPAGFLRRIARDAVDLVYPPACAVCQCDAQSDSPLCERCLLDLEEATAESSCGACGRPVGSEGGKPGACPWCDGRGVGLVKRVARLGLMAPPLREVIHLIKFHGRWELAAWLGQRLAEHEAVRALLAQTDVIVPVPLHTIRQTYRGYNQSMLIARQLKRASGLPIIMPALRARSTVAQTSLSSVAARQKNLRDAFVLLDPSAITGKRLILVDDVMTTGATLRSFAWTLWAARPAGLSAVVAAIADPRGRRFEVA